MFSNRLPYLVFLRKILGYLWEIVTISIYVPEEIFEENWTIQAGTPDVQVHSLSKEIVSENRLDDVLIIKVLISSPVNTVVGNIKVVYTIYITSISLAPVLSNKSTFKGGFNFNTIHSFFKKA